MRGVTAQSAADLKFLLAGKDGKADKMVTIPEYYKQVHNVTVTKPRLVSTAIQGI
jgi:eukaryotic translation initiation factor 2C